MMHKFIIAPPGAGKTLYARQLAETPPFPLQMSDSDRHYIYRVAGLDRPNLSHTRAPFRAPHHTVSLAGLGGVVRNRYRWQPGEVSLAHGGTLFLDEVTEFRRDVLEALLEPLKTGTLTVGCLVVPARFRLVCAMNPCPCGYTGSERREYRCAPKTIESYLARVPQWLRDACELVTADELIKSVGEIV